MGCQIDGRDGEIVTDQIRTVDKSRLKKRITTLTPNEQAELQDVLRQMFCE
ncbi:MAG: type II toxin-antitoxin system PemK/MazF family toxin [Bacteroidaceae bacterium]|nr:type II toxin-antitoxin system PemK/MazF family toxin [Bacteroidaceae bacterium]